MSETTAASTGVPVPIQLIGGTAGVGKTALACGAARHLAAQP